MGVEYEIEKGFASTYPNKHNLPLSPGLCHAPTKIKELQAKLDDAEWNYSDEDKYDVVLLKKQIEDLKRLLEETKGEFVPLF